MTKEEFEALLEVDAITPGSEPLAPPFISADVIATNSTLLHFIVNGRHVVRAYNQQTQEVTLYNEQTVTVAWLELHIDDPVFITWAITHKNQCHLIPSRSK